MHHGDVGTCVSRTGDSRPFYFAQLHPGVAGISNSPGQQRSLRVVEEQALLGQVLRDSVQRQVRAGYTDVIGIVRELEAGGDSVSKIFLHFHARMVASLDSLGPDGGPCPS